MHDCRKRARPRDSEHCSSNFDSRRWADCQKNLPVSARQTGRADQRSRLRLRPDTPPRWSSPDLDSRPAKLARSVQSFNRVTDFDGRRCSAPGNGDGFGQSRSRRYMHNVVARWRRVWAPAQNLQFRRRMPGRCRGRTRRWCRTGRRRGSGCRGGRGRRMRCWRRGGTRRWSWCRCLMRCWRWRRGGTRCRRCARTG